MTDCRAALQELVRLHNVTENYGLSEPEVAAWAAARAALALPVPEPGLPSEYHGRSVQFTLEGKHYTLYEVGTQADR
jgi:hypothetical protein